MHEISWKDLAGLFDLMPETQIWIKDRDGRFLACSRAFLAHFGFSRPKDLEGRTDFDVSPHHLAQEYVADDRMIMASGKTIRDKLELVREKDGNLNWYSTTKVPLRGPRGEVIGTAGMTLRLRGVDAGKKPGRDIGKAVRRIHAHYGEGLTVVSLAETAGMSVDAFERRFRAAFRETPLKYLSRIRIRAACSLLIHTGLSIGDVARQCGYSDPSYFSKRFYAHIRATPVEYRRKFSNFNNSPNG